MITLRKADARGHAHCSWLENWHSFSFADYQDPAHVRFGALRVINEDIVQPEAGFDMHGHRDMEIVTYILSGRLRLVGRPRNSHFVLKQSSPTTPDQPPLLGGAQGKEEQKM